MRDAGRIDKILEEIGALWKKYPDLRLGQLINNAVTEPLLYYIEDDKMVAELKRFYDLAGGTDSTDGENK